MSGAVISGLAGAVVFAMIVVLGGRLSGSPAARARIGGEFARTEGLLLAPEQADRVVDRIRSRRRAALVVTVPLVMLVGFTLCYSVWQTFTQHDPLPPALILVFWLTMLISGLQEILGYLAERAGARREGAAPAQAGGGRRYGPAMPSVSTWLVRGIVAVAVLVGAVVAGVAATRPAPLIAGLVAVAAGSVILLVVAEAGQRRVLRGPRLGYTEADQATDDAFRIRAALAIGQVPAGVALLSVLALAWPMVDGPDGYRAGLLGLLCVDLLLLIGLASGLIMVIPWWQRYVRSRWRPPTGPGGQPG